MALLAYRSPCLVLEWRSIPKIAWTSPNRRATLCLPKGIVMKVNCTSLYCYLADLVLLFLLAALRASLKKVISQVWTKVSCDDPLPKQSLSLREGKKKKKKDTSFEPDSNQRPMDFSIPLQSTALPTELSKELSTTIANECI